MNLRERPEFQEWRQAVFHFFGRGCLACGGADQVQIHHVRPLKACPQLALDPANGAPLCDSCFARIKQGELKYLHDLRRAQSILGEGPPLEGAPDDGPAEDEIWQRAEAEPSNSEAVETCFARSTNAARVIEFYSKHHQSFRKTPMLFAYLAHHLMEAQRFEDVLAVLDGVGRCAERRGRLAEWTYLLAWNRAYTLACLNRKSESIRAVEDAVRALPEHAALRRMLALKLAGAAGWQHASEECVEHARKAAELAPDDFFTALLTANVLRLAGEFPAAQEMAEKAATLAATETDRGHVYYCLAQIHSANGIYDEAVENLQKILDFDQENITALAEMANCYYMLDRRNDARKMAREGLMIAPEDKTCQHILEICGEGR